LDKFRDDFGLAGGGSGLGPREIFSVLVGARKAAALPLVPARRRSTGLRFNGPAGRIAERTRQ